MFESFPRTKNRLVFPLILSIFINRFDGSAPDKCIHHAMVFDAFLYVLTEELCAACVGFNFD